MHNEVIKNDIHSTDTHGFTEAIFAATHLIDTAFAPRIKRIGRQRLYGFSSKATHQRRGDVIVPSRRIDQKLILRHWDDILRFMATIKLRHSSASQLFKRLSSYASYHPLYKALKEFGRLIKTSLFSATTTTWNYVNASKSSSTKWSWQTNFQKQCSLPTIKNFRTALVMNKRTRPSAKC